MMARMRRDGIRYRIVWFTRHKERESIRMGRRRRRRRVRMVTVVRMTERNGSVRYWRKRDKMVNIVGSRWVPYFSKKIGFIMERSIIIILFTNRAKIKVFTIKAIKSDARNRSLAAITDGGVDLVVTPSFS